MRTLYRPSRSRSNRLPGGWTMSPTTCARCNWSSSRRARGQSRGSCCRAALLFRPLNKSSVPTSAKVRTTGVLYYNTRMSGMRKHVGSAPLRRCPGSRGRSHHRHRNVRTRPIRHASARMLESRAERLKRPDRALGGPGRRHRLARSPRAARSRARAGLGIVARRTCATTWRRSASSAPPAHGRIRAITGDPECARTWRGTPR